MHRRIGRRPTALRRGHRAMAGLSLLELVVAIAVLSIGTLAALRASDQARLVIGGAEPRVLAQLVAQNRAEELRLLGSAVGRSLPEHVTMGPQGFVVATTYETTAAGLVRAEITARADSGMRPGPGALVVTWLPRAGVN
ncbi:prepilin-type N-terminal cleavage/methylation domain-containing protein [Puniceibacterium sp. IMCC21224]|uniref:type IV pilus modification PilV family protein n=1 Tax=Puniceibacterium sp. IMCC21224 TaxID=1618204 RepID=UPI00065D6789|nr:prepilin-type N-terminal cleavage/methylation domain-containing protein [Puniceibacterium sp. IMCC21224]KMK64005.1 prepilin-type N-terminal cleavage/methylation domain-containing protein [Puniceibacterium sp. IMCC21224]